MLLFRRWGEQKGDKGLSHRFHISGLILAGLFSSHPLTAEEFDGGSAQFELFKQQSERDFQNSKDEFERHRRRLLDAFEQYRALSAKVWGDRQTVLPDRTNWVSYQGDMQHRSVVDFEQGSITVDLALPLDRLPSDVEARKQLTDHIVRSLNLGKDDRSVVDLARQPVARSSGTPVLRGLVDDGRGRPAGNRDYAELARRAAGRAEQISIRGGDGQKRMVYRARLSLVPDHIRKRAARFQDEIQAQSAEQRIPAAMIFAIMETESMFNPTARSPAPAFGLMQLVPTAGAREAYRYLYKSDRVVSDTYLYNPKNNIRLGTAFLNRLYYKYFAGIENSDARQWATIAAYNTGAGNVFRSFAGKYSGNRYKNREQWKRAALREINRRSAEQVFTFLHNHLPYRETRTYIKTVRSRMAKYRIP